MSRLARLGLFVVGSLILLSAAVFIVGSQRLLFRSTYRLHAAFDQAAGLPNGADVRVGGVRKGKVEQIYLPRQPGGKVIVAMNLESSTREIIKKDSFASIETEGLLGNKYVAISFGSDKAEQVGNGDTIGSVPPVDLSDVIKKTNELVETAQAAFKNVDRATSDLQSVTAKIDQGQGTVGALINDKQVYEQVKAATADVRATAEQTKRGATAFQENMQALKQNWFFRRFFNKRGYTDSTELTKHEVAQWPEGPYAKKFTYRAKDLFGAADTAKLKNEKSLDKVGEFLEKNRFGLVVVAAYSGWKGDTEDDLRITQARAMVVRQYLVDKFRLDDTRIKTKGLGKDYQTPSDEADRVEIILYSEGTRGLARDDKKPARPSETSAN